ncbi:aminotransferase [Pseudohalocynthiibacter aestuariivivens]|uniref:Aminotransferase n=1 Tax=Roseovarius pelagicus TaxID=2980108 RepID=A0ABY6DBF5_9RHOB|nr:MULTISPECIES: aminotransferase [Rhodobacterales]QIE44630.1 aminotransferase [Pseudohalocynthiibacter aestuariivivens]UXX83466.1 aminotransferase [Roseovarius pelagicus]
MTAQTKTDAWTADRDHLLHPYTDFSTFREEGSQVIESASGMHVIDSEGNKLLDGIGGLWCVNIGHGRKEMAETIAEQVMKMQYYNPFGHSTNVPASMLGAKLAELAPGDLNHVYYTCGGSTANDAAIRLVHFYFDQLGQHRKKKIISRANAYHGATYVAASLTGIHGTKMGFDRIGEDFIHHVSAANLYEKPDGWSDADYCDYLVREFDARIQQLGPDNVAAFIAEPIMGAGGVLVAPDGYHRRMWEVCQKYDMLYIADEVVTAFGRLGEWFASDALYDYQPDIMVCAKGLSSGYIPLGATLLSTRVYDVIAQPQCEGGVLSMGLTYFGHPVACAAALKNIEIMERENILEHVREVGPYLQESAKSLMNLPIVGDVRGSHLMLGVDLVKDKGTKEAIGDGVGEKIFQGCLKRGVIVRPVGDRMIVSPPLIISKEECDEIVAAISGAIKDYLADEGA